MANNLAGKIAVVTGASRGLGFALARSLGLESAQVIALGRTAGGLEELDDSIRTAGGPAAVLVPVDLASGHEQLDRLGATLHERFGRVDIFIHAAAMLGSLGPLAHQSPNDVTRMMNVNALACYRLLRSFDALFRAAENPIIAGIGCELGDTAQAFWGPYRASKAAMKVLIETYGAETKFRTLIHTPQAMATKLHATAYPGIDFATLVQPQDEAAKVIKLLAA